MNVEVRRREMVWKMVSDTFFDSPLRGHPSPALEKGV